MALLLLVVAMQLQLQLQDTGKYPKKHHIAPHLNNINEVNRSQTIKMNTKYDPTINDNSDSNCRPRNIMLLSNCNRNIPAASAYVRGSYDGSLSPAMTQITAQSSYPAYAYPCPQRPPPSATMDPRRHSYPWMTSPSPH